MLCIGATISIYYNKLKKHCSKIHLYEKENLGEKTMQFFYKIIVMGHCILFAPQLTLV
jgi:hypothetical protein